MCSISGIFTVLHAPLPRTGFCKAVEKMNAALRHRGPDDHGIAEVDLKTGGNSCTHLCLGNTRLAIIDTSAAGHQPMHEAETGNWITYNGETYNFRELRREIGNEFGPWRSHTDTEVVLRAYRKWGVKAFEKLRGMFALAIWDSARQELILARDRFGIKPLYYNTGQTNLGEATDRFLIFASEVRALLASGLVQRRLSADAVASYLEYGSVQAPLSIVETVKSLMPGQYLRVGVSGETQLCNFASLINPAKESQVQTRAEAVARLRVKLEDSVRLHLISDVPTGVFLSGGMDSSALVGLMSRVTNDRPKTFSVVFDEEAFSEASHSRAVAERFHTDHCEVRLKEEDLLQMLPAAVRSLDQPTMDGINTYVVSKAVKEAGVTVALSGLGGDELFAGYPSFGRAIRMDSMSTLTRTLMRGISGAGSRRWNGSVQRNKFWQLAASDGSAAQVYKVSRQLFAPDELVKLALQVSDRVTASNGAAKLDSVVNEMSRLELKGYMHNTLLRDTDAVSMAHSLEVRVPFVDANVVSFVLSLPGEWKHSGGEEQVPKPLLADALKDLLPGDFLARPKKGFILPFNDWLQGRLRSEVASVFSNTAVLEKAGLNPDFTAGVWRRFLKSPRNTGWSRPWALYVLARWCERNL